MGGDCGVGYRGWGRVEGLMDGWKVCSPAGGRRADLPCNHTWTVKVRVSSPPWLVSLRHSVDSGSSGMLAFKIRRAPGPLDSGTMPRFYSRHPPLRAAGWSWVSKPLIRGLMPVLLRTTQPLPLMSTQLVA